MFFVMLSHYLSVFLFPLATKTCIAFLSCGLLLLCLRPQSNRAKELWDICATTSQILKSCLSWVLYQSERRLTGMPSEWPTARTLTIRCGRLWVTGPSSVTCWRHKTESVTWAGSLASHETKHTPSMLFKNCGLRYLPTELKTYTPNQTLYISVCSSFTLRCQDLGSKTMPFCG